MKTKVTASAPEAARVLLKNELVAFPTETVYGLGANIFSESAIEEIYRVKGRPSDNPLIAHISNLTELVILVKRVPKSAELLIDSFFPGPLTLVLEKSRYVPGCVTGGLDTLGVRMPSNPVAQLFLKECGVSIAAPSANRSGRPSPTTWQAAKAELDGLIGCILKGDQSQVGLESTIVDCTQKNPVLLRSGAIGLEDLQKVVPTIQVQAHDRDGPPKSPGQKYRHYAPEAKVVIVDDASEIASSSNSAYIGLEHLKTNTATLTKTCQDVEDYAFALFDFFRQCEAEHIQIIYCQRVAEKGIGRALMDRLSRAATHS
jgi:L-threonylcarbamoyladenylate synthase